MSEDLAFALACPAVEGAGDEALGFLGQFVDNRVDAIGVEFLKAHV